MKRLSKDGRWRSLCFEYHEALRAVIDDLAKLDGLIPAESSRISLPEMQDEATAIIVARKNDLLGYIQTICRDHMLFGKKVLDKGWSVD